MTGIQPFSYRMFINWQNQVNVQDLRFLSRGDRDPGLHSRLTLVVRPHLEGKQRTPLSSWVSTGISWSPLSDLKGVKPPLEFGERIRDCSSGHAGKKALISPWQGRLVGFLELQRQCGVSHEVLRGAQGASHVAPGKSGVHAHGEGERVIALESW